MTLQGNQFHDRNGLTMKSSITHDLSSCQPTSQLPSATICNNQSVNTKTDNFKKNANL